MAEHFHLDSLDKRILKMLVRDARIPFLEIARQCGVSGAAIHQRVQKMVDEAEERLRRADDKIYHKASARNRLQV